MTKYEVYLHPSTKIADMGIEADGFDVVANLFRFYRLTDLKPGDLKEYEGQTQKFDYFMFLPLANVIGVQKKNDAS
jgi:small nuclear ribonucleoprotein (snRNP)-like protein